MGKLIVKILKKVKKCKTLLELRALGKPGP